MSLACRRRYLTERPSRRTLIVQLQYVVFAVPDDKVLISDGGLATELEARGHDLSDALWSARLLVDAPQEIIAVHLAFFRAGADDRHDRQLPGIVRGFRGTRIGRDDADRLLRRSVELAKDGARRGRGRWPLDCRLGRALRRGAGQRRPNTVGRYGLTHRGSWPSGIGRGWRSWPTPAPTCWRWKPCPMSTRPKRWSTWCGARCAGLAELHRSTGRDTRAGQPLGEAFAVAAGVPEIVAVGVNCCAPADVLPAVEIARDSHGKPVIVYPNSGEAGTGSGAPGSARRDGRRTWRRSGSRRAHASSAGAAG